jgi:hypothetical protein
LYSVAHPSLQNVIPAKAGIQELSQDGIGQSARHLAFLDSRFRGNDARVLGEFLTLTLFVLGVFADDGDATATTNHLALGTNTFNRSSNFHGEHTYH